MRIANSTFAKTFTLTFVALSTIAIGQCFGIPDGVTIINPQGGKNLVSGKSQTFSGDMRGAQHKDGSNWVVDYPTIRLEFYFDSSPDYLITSTQSAMTFPGGTTRGAWSGSLTISQVAQYVTLYYLYAVPLNPFNVPDHSMSDQVYYPVVNGG